MKLPSLVFASCAAALLLGLGYWQISVRDRQAASGAETHSVAPAPVAHPSDSLDGPPTTGETAKAALAVPSETSQEENPENAPTASKDRQPDGMMRSPFPVVVATPGTPIEPSRWHTIGSLGRTPIPDSVFDQKYPPETTLGTLAGEALEKQRLAGELMHARILEKFTFGDFDDALIPEDSTVTDDQGNRGIALSKYVDTPEYAQIIPRYAMRPYHGQGDRNLGFAWLRFEDNEDIYALFDEANYLQKRYASSTK